MTERPDERRGGETPDAWSPFASREEAAMALYRLLERCGLLDLISENRSGGAHAVNARRRPAGKDKG
jgi:hypothetical protein